ncbi:MAG: DUF5702 domain-containing protein [Butyrivibrio sp.]|nr:DUF5702 domain-containing protein [Butyrivibrio sp.]
MNWWVKRQRGGVTIFLTIILVPMIVLCTLFIDASRVNLAKGVATSSADLALNTVLSQYDVDLEDYYGLMGSVQDIEEIYEPAEKSFVLGMQSTDVPTTYLQQKVSQIRKIFGKSKKYNDLLNVDSGASSAKIENVPNANLANPGMMRQQVTEFMKYRAPADLVLDTVHNKQKYSELYYKMTTTGTKAKNMVYEAKIQEAKQDFFQAKSDMLMQALKVYEILKEYEKLQITCKFMKDTKATDLQLKDDFKELHSKYLENWTHVDDLWEKDFKSAEKYKNDEHGSLSGTDFSADTITKCADALKKAIEEYNDALTTINTKLDGITHCEEAYLTMEDVSHTRYWVQLEQDLSESEYDAFIGKLKTLKQCYDDLNTAYTDKYVATPDDDDYPYDAGSEPYDGRTIDEKVPGIISSGEALLNDLGNTSVGKISARADEYFGVTSGDVKRDVADKAIWETVQKTEKGTKSTGDPNSELFKERYERIFDGNELIGEKYSPDLLPNAYIEDTLNCQTAKLQRYIDEYHKKYVAWGDSMQDGKDHGLTPEDSPILKDSENDRQVYEHEEGKDKINDSEGPETEQDMEIDLVEHDCEVYVEYLVRVSELFQKHMKAAENISYHGKKILGTDLTAKKGVTGSGINKLETFDEAARKHGSGKKVNKDEVPVGTDKLSHYADETFEFNADDAEALEDPNCEYTLGPDAFVESSTLNSPCVSAEDKYPITKGNTGIKIPLFLHWQFDDKFKDVDKPTEEVNGLVSYLKELFGGAISDFENEFKSYDNIHRMDENEIKNQENLPSTLSGATPDESEMVEGGEKNTADTTTQTKGITSAATWLSKLGDITEAMRDDLYETDYVMSMFSYDTHYMETIYNHASKTESEASKDSIYTVKNWAGSEVHINPGTAKDLFDTAEATKYMGSKKTTDSYNKSMTNKIIGAMSLKDSIPMPKDGKDEVGTGYNWAYGNEIEYILSGSTNEKNRKRIDTVLYFTRLACNMSPVYAEYWTKVAWVSRIAEAVCELTCGIVPIPLTKFVICTVILSLESYVDEQYLLAGLPVKFFKANIEEFFVDLKLDWSDLKKMIEAKSKDTKLFKPLDPDVRKNSGDLVLSYSDYLGIAVFLETIVNKDHLYSRTADTVQVNIAQNARTDKKDFQMSKALTYYTIDTSVRVKPMMVALPYCSDYGFKSLLETDTWNTFTYKTVEGY